MNNERIHPVLRVPPIAHALHKWDEASKTLCYEYNGIDILQVSVPEAQEVGFRHGSDGSIQSVQYMQQIYLTVDRPMEVVLTICLSEDTVVMRPHRAKNNQAILGQLGKSLIEGVNGIYDVNQDLLIDFHGCPWRWVGKTIAQDQEGHSKVQIAVTLSEKPFFVNLRMHYYSKHLGYHYHKPWQFKPKMKATAGWCSWEAYRRDIDQEKIDEVVAFMEKELRDYGLEYIQIDDGYQKMPLPYDPKDTMAQGWLTTEENKFPKGHEGIVASIAHKGFVPGIWTNANITNPEFLKYHEKDILWYQGEALKGEWIDYLYSCEAETLATHVEPLFESFKALGYDYIKIDAIRHLLFDGLHEAVRLGMMSNEEAEKKFRAYMEATRRGLGDQAYYLASWGEMHEVIGLVDGCRIAMDANPTWAGIRMQLFESARWFHTQRILFQMDPDHVCVRTQEQWAKSVLSLISLSGGLYMLSDKPEVYDQDKLEIIRKTLPPLQTRTAETGSLELSYPAYTWTKLHGFAVQSNEKPVEAEGVTLKDAIDMAGIFPTMDEAHPFSSLWAFHLEHVGRNWCVMGRFATMPLQESHISLESLGLSQTETYLAFDFWEQRFLGQVTGELACKALEIGECQIIAFYAVEKAPQLIASTRHVSMDAISIMGYRWDESTSTLGVEVSGVSGSEETYTFYVPEAYTLAVVAVEGGVVHETRENNILSIKVNFGTALVQLKLGFAKAVGGETK